MRWDNRAGVIKGGTFFFFFFQRMEEEEGIVRERLKVRVGFSHTQKSGRNLQAIQEDLIRIKLVADSSGELRSIRVNPF